VFLNKNETDVSEEFYFCLPEQRICSFRFRSFHFYLYSRQLYSMWFTIWNADTPRSTDTRHPAAVDKLADLKPWIKRAHEPLNKEEEEAVNNVSMTNLNRFGGFPLNQTYGKKRNNLQRRLV